MRGATNLEDAKTWRTKITIKVNRAKARAASKVARAASKVAKGASRVVKVVSSLTSKDKRAKGVNSLTSKAKRGKVVRARVAGTVKERAELRN